MQAYCMKCRAKKEMKDPKVYHNEKWQTSNSGCMPHLRHEDVPDWESLKQVYN